MSASLNNKLMVKATSSLGNGAWAMGMGDAAGGVGCLRRCIGTKKLRGFFRHEYKDRRSAKGRYVVS